MKVGLEQLGQGAGIPGSVGGDNFWSPKNIQEVIKGIGGLLEQYKLLKAGGIGVNPDQGVLSSPGQPGITMVQVTSFGKQLLDNLISQGYGDKTPLNVLEGFNVTIKQLKGMIP